jgi:hypothetical protein
VGNIHVFTGRPTYNLVTLPAPIASTASATATFELPPDDCLFDLTFTLATTATILQPDMDLCNLDGFVVE